MLVFYKLLHNWLLSFVLSLTGVGQPFFTVLSGCKAFAVLFVSGWTVLGLDFYEL